MHLLASPLCFEISFLIADVTTPILGVDTLLRENLSLRIEGNQQQLVHQSGEYQRDSFFIFWLLLCSLGVTST